MFGAIEFIYILTTFICVAGFSIHITVKFKGLPATSSLAKQGSTTGFLLTILVFNLCDFMIIYLEKIMPDPDMGALYIFENVLEVILIYTMIQMEREYAGFELPRSVEAVMAAICMLLIYFDGIFEWKETDEELVYFYLMIAINAVPILILTACSVKFFRSPEVKGKNTKVNAYLTVFICACIFLCIVCTMTNADLQTRHRFIYHPRELYEIIWLIFNIMTFAFVWRTINTGNGEWSSESDISEDRIFTNLKREYNLSDRELEIAKLVYQGKNNKDIANELFLSPNTVKVHASNLYHKLGVSNRVQAVQAINRVRENS